MKDRDTLILEALSRLLSLKDCASLGAALISLHQNLFIIFAVTRYADISFAKFPNDIDAYSKKTERRFHTKFKQSLLNLRTVLNQAYETGNEQLLLDYARESVA